MAEALADRGHEVHVVTYHLGSGPVSPAVRVHRIRDLGFYRKLSPGPSYRKLLFVDPYLVTLLRRLLREMDFDVIHAHHYEGVLVGAMARRGRRVPMVYDAHTLLMSELPFYSLGLPTGLKRAAGLWIDRHVPRLANHTVCVTETIRGKLIGDAGMDPGQLSVISNGVEFEHFNAPGTSRLAGNRPPTLVFTGNLAEYQGIDLMLQAFQRVLQRAPATRLVIASDTPFDAYETLANELGVRQQVDIVRSPAFKDLPAVLAAGDIALNPRVDCDGIPVKLLNYMAAGRPVVSFASSAPGVVHARTGWLAESGNIQAFADGVVTLIEDRVLATRLGDAAREYVSENCRWSIVAERCEALYRRMIAA